MGRQNGKTFEFQSTLPSRGATVLTLRTLEVDYDFNPRSPRGERHPVNEFGGGFRVISIHAPLAGSDAVLSGLANLSIYFNPRSPRGERPSSQ